MADKGSETSLKNDVLEVNQQFLKHNKPDSLGINEEKPKFPQYAVVSKRTDSYRSWPSYLPIKPDILVDAGLVFTGVGDSVRCYHCRGGLWNWEEGDDPWEEHAKWYPKCPHVVLVKGQHYVDCVGRGEKPPTEMDGASAFKKASKDEMSDSQLLDTVAAISCKENGYPNEIILKAMKLFQKNNKGSTDFKAAYIVGIILELEEEEEGAVGGEGAGSSVYDCWDEQEDPDEVAKLYEEYQTMNEYLMCKFCRDGVANVIFLPCGHMIGCLRCAPAVVKCPRCQLVISGTVKTYFEWSVWNFIPYCFCRCIDIHHTIAVRNEVPYILLHSIKWFQRKLLFKL